MENKDPVTEAVDRVVEEGLYAMLLKEVEGGKRRDGLWAKALTDTGFNEKSAKTLYMKYRLQSIKDEMILKAAEEEKQRWIAETRKEQLILKANELAQNYYKRSEFETWFNTTNFSHKDADREYLVYLQGVIEDEGIDYKEHTEVYDDLPQPSDSEAQAKTNVNDSSEKRKQNRIKSLVYYPNLLFLIYLFIHLFTYPPFPSGSLRGDAYELGIYFGTALIPIVFFLGYNSIKGEAKVLKIMLTVVAVLFIFMDLVALLSNKGGLG